jgi:hypothetical protein
MGDMTRVVDPQRIAGLAMDSVRVPNQVGPEVGWRAWNLKRELPHFGNAPRLESATHAYTWIPKVAARAYCPHEEEDENGERNHVPGETCSCGFYSAKTLNHLRQLGYSNYDENSEWITIVGELSLWGKVIEGSQGWRAEFAYPKRLFLPFEAWKLARPIQKAYGVKVSLLNLLDPDADPDEARELPGVKGKAA